MPGWTRLAERLSAKALSPCICLPVACIAIATRSPLYKNPPSSKALFQPKTPSLDSQVPLGTDSHQCMQQAIRMAAAAPWKEPLQRALKENAPSRDCRYIQLATVRPNGCPANRTVVYRGFLDDSDVLTFVTDSRSRKIAEIAHSPWGEVAWYFPTSREQFRLLGKLTVVDSQTEDPALQQGRLVAWKNMSDPGRQQFLWPPPGEQRSGSYDSAFKAEPPTTLDPVLETFCLVCLAVEEVDHIQLSKNLRHLYLRQPAAAGGSEGDEWSIQNVNP